MFKNLKYIVIDVDGTLTDGGIYYDENGNETKKFNTKDAAGFFVLKKLGIKTVIITGRECAATARRMKELNVDYLFQNIKNKTGFLANFIQENNINKSEIGYIGDDLNDYAPMQLTGFIGCPKNACKEIVSIANYVSKLNGGEGAVREIVEHLLEAEGLWQDNINEVYQMGI